MNKEFNAHGRQEREEILNENLTHSAKEIEYLHNKNKQLNNRIDELETIIERHLSGWCIIIVLTIAIVVGTFWAN